MDYLALLAAAVGLAVSCASSACLVAVAQVSEFEIEFSMVSDDPAVSAQAHKIVRGLGNYSMLVLSLVLLSLAPLMALPLILQLFTLYAYTLSLVLSFVLSGLLPSLFVYRQKKLSACAAVIPWIQVAKLLTSPVTWPLSWILDKILIFRTPLQMSREYARIQVKEELQKLVTVEEGTRVEKNFIGAVLQMSERVESVMIPIDSVECIRIDTVLTEAEVARLLRYSRLPVLHKNKVVGVLRTKALVYIPNATLKESSTQLRPPQFVDAWMPLPELLVRYPGRQMLIVHRNRVVVGVVFLTDVLKQMFRPTNLMDKLTEELTAKLEVYLNQRQPLRSL